MAYLATACVEKIFKINVVLLRENLSVFGVPIGKREHFLEIFKIQVDEIILP